MTMAIKLKNVACLERLAQLLARNYKIEVFFSVISSGMYSLFESL